ncbi:hypothetical protein FZC35_01770 [Candidatus Cytomitobacter indipagum]|uniref:Uncharacterized protein n=1 Tax=Candidatus Cytomitobacter indipagum TaxID=2601575 RepID=A0A5C0UEG3_9PROT|nr:hypothetical protein [Candidatus Cytomitobacter indipagum]QEK38097.1 hypothetical protein FZC35_01770 [Candidatus Cytomitobacter indipagum]
MHIILHLPNWDTFLQTQINQSNCTIKTWSPNLEKKSHLNPYQVVQEIFSKINDDGYFFLSFIKCGRFYFSPPENDQEACEVIKKMEGRRTRIYYALRQPNAKYKISEEWIMLKRMNDSERLLTAPKLKNYQEFLRLSGQSVILKSGSTRNPFNLLHNHNII